MSSQYVLPNRVKLKRKKISRTWHFSWCVIFHKIVGDLNGHVGRSDIGYVGVIVGFGLGS